MWQFMFDALTVWNTGLAGLMFAGVVMHSLFGEAIFTIREKTEGLPYNLSIGSRYGDTFLILGCLIGMYILQQKGIEAFPWWLKYDGVHVVVLALTIPVVAKCTNLPGDWRYVPRRWGDIYHNVFILPLLFYLVVVLGQVIAFVGDWQQRGGAALLVFAWVLCVLSDARNNRFDQRSRLDAWAKKLPE